MNFESNGRDANGRFTHGNAGGPGSPLAGKAMKLRAALMDAVGEDDIKAIAAALVVESKTGNVSAIKELLDRLLGKALEADLIARLESLETMLNDRIRGDE